VCSLPRKERESNPQGSSPPVFKTVAIATLACPSRLVEGGGSGGNRTRVLRFKRPVQPSFCYRPVVPPDGESVGMGCWRHPCLRTVELSENTSVRSGPRSRTRSSRFRAARPAIGPVRITGRVRSAQRFRSSDDALAGDPQKREGHRGLPRWPHLASALRAGQARGAAPPGNLPRLAHSCTPPASRAGWRLLSAFDEFSRMACSRRMTRATLSDESNQYATARRLSIQNRDERVIGDLDARHASRFHRGEFFPAHAARRRRASTWATRSSQSASAATPPRDSGSPSAMASAVRSIR
jgi:hypothetical protein